MAVISLFVLGKFVHEHLSDLRKGSSSLAVCKELAQNYGFEEIPGQHLEAWQGDIEGVSVSLTVLSDSVRIDTNFSDIEGDDGFVMRRRVSPGSERDAFDASIEIRGRPPTPLLASMSKEQRDRINQLLSPERNFRLIEKRGVIVQVPHPESETTSNWRAELNNIISTSVEVAKAVRDASVADLWPVASGRSTVSKLAHLRLLSDHATSDTGQKAIAEGLDHPDREIRLNALGAAGPEATEQMLHTLSTDDDDWYDTEALIGKAFGRLVGAESAALLASVLEKALRNQSNRELRIALIRAVRQQEFAPAAPVLADCLATMHDEELSQAVAALRAIGGPIAMAGLAERLRESGTSTEEALPIIQALGARGTRKSVEALKPMTEGLFRNQEIKEAARYAILNIQSRLAGAGAGHLALAEDQELGGLAIAVGGGELAMSETEAADGTEVTEEKAVHEVVAAD